MPTGRSGGHVGRSASVDRPALQRRTDNTLHTQPRSDHYAQPPPGASAFCLRPRITNHAPPPSRPSSPSRRPAAEQLGPLEPRVPGGLHAADVARVDGGLHEVKHPNLHSAARQLLRQVALRVLGHLRAKPVHLGHHVLDVGVHHLAQLRAPQLRLARLGLPPPGVAHQLVPEEHRQVVLHWGVLRRERLRGGGEAGDEGALDAVGREEALQVAGEAEGHVLARALQIALHVAHQIVWSGISI
eukprot:1192343-Prorocentrum_minimum.AAC.3